MIEYVKKADVLEIINSPLPRDIAAEYLYELKGVWLDEDEGWTMTDTYLGKPVEINIPRINKVKNVIRNRYIDAKYGLFFNRNWASDPMSTIWEEDGVTIDICYDYGYFEVFGLTKEEENELLAFYDSLIEGDCI